MEPSRTKILYVVLLILSFSLVVLFRYDLAIYNERGHTVSGNVSVFLWKIPIQSFRNASSFSTILPIGTYSITINAAGYNAGNLTFQNYNPLTKHISHRSELKSRIIDLSAFTFNDPTGTLRLDPLASINGTNILGDTVHETGVKRFLYGKYNATLADPHFSASVQFHGDKLLLYGQETERMRLDPARTTLLLTPAEANYAMQYLADFLNLSSNRYIQINPGFPQQFSLRRPDTVLSLGDMLFLLCEMNVYHNTGEENPVYFIPWNKKYSMVDSTFNAQDCYAHALAGYIPQAINASSMSIIAGDADYPLLDAQLNTKNRKLPIAFTFDIESGRYVHNGNKGLHAISPCSSAVFGLGLSDKERICDADMVGWFSPLLARSYSSHPYPWISGILGFKDILHYSERYGIPTTLYIVDREVRVMNQLEPELIGAARQLAETETVEIGSHTPYHINLDVFPLQKASDQLKESRHFLEETFNTTVSGFRGPYLSIVAGDVRTHELALQEAGYSYYSQDVLEDEGIASIISKPKNFDFISEGNQTRLANAIDVYGYIATLDHPWNFYYDEILVDDEVFLKENPENAAKAQAMVLLAISQGAIPVQMRELQAKEFK